MSSQRTVLIACWLAGLPGVGHGQDDADPSIEYYADARLRAEALSGIPGGRDLDRARLHAYLGLRWFRSSAWELGAAAKLSAGTDENRDNVRNLDNEESNELELGEAYLRFFPSADSSIEGGRAALPFKLSPMLWDHDLRPTGISYQQDFSFRDFDRIRLTGGWFAGLNIDESDTELAAAQIDWQIREGAPSGGAVTLSYLSFADLDGLIEDGRARTNAVSGGAYVNDYELLDVQLSGRWSAFGGLVAAVDLVDNLDVGDDDQGARLTVVLGDALRAGGWEFGYAIQRIQKEAVVAAFNEDDWWFPSAMRGFRIWAGYGFGEGLGLRLAGFRERRDGLDEHVERLQLDLIYTR